MKRCPFCAEQIQDEAIKCRYCGSMLSGAVPSVSIPATDTSETSSDKEIRDLILAGKGRDAVTLVAQQRNLSWFKAVSVVSAMIKADPALAAEVSKAKGQPWSEKKQILVGLGISAALIAATFVFAAITYDPDASNRPNSATSAINSNQPATPDNSNVSAERTRRAVAAREAIPGFVSRGFIKRMDLERGSFYVDGPLWDSFELSDKQNMVKMISWYREAEYKGLPQVTLYESRSGKELANYGAFTGVTIR